MPARAEVDYNPTATVNPEATGGGQPFSVRANPNDFGGQVGEAEKQGGATLGEAANQQFDFQMKQQGLLNEAAATDGETQYEMQKDKIVQNFKSLEGFAATPDSPAYQKALTDISSLRQQMVGTMRSPNASKAFNTLSLRHEASGIDDINSYATQQVKAASNNSAKAQLELAVTRSSNFDVAKNDDRFNDIEKDVDFSLGIMLPNQGYGPDGGTGMKVDPDSGKISFNDTDRGRQAQAVYQNTRDKAIGQAWQNRIETLTNDPTQGNALKANEIYQAHKSEIPPEAQVKISGFLVAKVRAASSRTFADQYSSNLDNGYVSTVTGSPSNPNNLGNVKNSTNTGFLNPASPVDGVIATVNNLRGGKYNGMTLAQIGQTWTGENPAKVSDWVHNASTASGISPGTVPNLHDPAVLHSLMKGIAVAEKNPQDRQAFTDDIISQGVQGALGGKRANFAVAGNQDVPTPPNTMSKADYYNANYAQIMSDARHQVDQQFPDDPVAADQAYARIGANIDKEITAQQRGYTADVHQVQSALVTPMADGTLPTSPEQLPQEARDAYTRAQINNPYAAMGADRIMAANSKGQAAGYGSNFYSFLQKVLAPSNDPDRIVDPNVLARNVVGGEDGPLTNTGARELQNLLGQRGTPQGDAAAAQLLGFLQKAHGMISGQTAVIADPKGEKNYGEFLKHAIPQVIAAQRSGSTTNLFDQKGDLYNSITNFMRPTQTQANDYIYRTDVHAADAWESQVKGLHLDVPADRQQAANSLISLAKQGKIPLAQAKALALKYKLAAANPPPVPLPR